MELGVLLEVAICGKSLAADSAQMLANIEMGVHVVGEAILLVEPLVADGAMERRLIEVCAPMDVKERPCLERLAAQIADVGTLPGVSAHVYGHLGGGGKMLVALLARIGKVTSMATYVHSEIAWHLESLAAQRTNEWLRAIVPGSMHLILIAGLDQLIANITAEWAQIRFEKLTQLGVQQRNATGGSWVCEYFTLLRREILPQLEQCLLQLCRCRGTLKRCVKLVEHLTQRLIAICIRAKIGMIHIPQGRIIAIDFHKLQLILLRVKAYAAGIDELCLLIRFHYALFLQEIRHQCLL